MLLEVRFGEFFNVAKESGWGSGFAAAFVAALAPVWFVLGHRSERDVFLAKSVTYE
jgi:hypothetical protein